MINLFKIRRLWDWVFRIVFEFVTRTALSVICILTTDKAVHVTLKIITMKVAVVGATGLVGGEILKVLAERNFPVTELIPVASERSVEIGRAHV